MIETYNENNLHYELKRHFCPEDGNTERRVGNFTCDILCACGKIIEIQTGNFAHIKAKLAALLPARKIEIVYPISVNTYLRLLNEDGSLRSRRKSPKHGSFFQIFKEFAPICHLLNHENLKIRLVYTETEVVKIDDKKGKSPYKRPRIIDRKLIKIENEEIYCSIVELTAAVMEHLPEEFTTADIKKAGGGKYTSYAAWFLEKTGLSKKIGKLNKYNLYKKSGKNFLPLLKV